MANESTSPRRRWWLLLLAVTGTVVWVLSLRRAGRGPGALDDARPAPRSLTVVPPAGGPAAGPADVSRRRTLHAVGGSDDTGASAAPVRAAAASTGRPGRAPAAAERPAPVTTPLASAPRTASASVTPAPVTAPGAPATPKATAPAKPVSAEPAADANPVGAEPAADANPVGAEPAADAEPVSAEPAPPTETAEPVAVPAEPAPATEPGPAVEVSSYGPGSALPLPDGSAPSAEYTIKGNATSMLFHTPSSPYFGRTKAEAWFRTPEDARRAGFTEWTRKPRRSG
ncbi:hypothetical protein [Pseudonocardia acidicola]|uniref:Membrane protein ArfC n=1 Tax=Pseudonocardia acidicola TaxID=2724939 RepID=A0ABX1SH35_9PSEU|nr:hypothetical protein [Pseudonocardia acidicola]NMI00885.1 hypothetical protein [Pseudonocardia acidicola]